MCMTFSDSLIQNSCSNNFNKDKKLFRDMARQVLPFKTEPEEVPEDDLNYQANGNKFRCPFRCMQIYAFDQIG